MWTNKNTSEFLFRHHYLSLYFEIKREAIKCENGTWSNSKEKMEKSEKRPRSNIEAISGPKMILLIPRSNIIKQVNNRIKKRQYGANNCSKHRLRTVN